MTLRIPFEAVTGSFVLSLGTFLTTIDDAVDLTVVLFIVFNDGLSILVKDLRFGLGTLALLRNCTPPIEPLLFVSSSRL